jgi:hypothetical protein
LRDELEAGRVPTIRSVFETGRQDHTEDPVTIAGIVGFRQEREGSVFGADVAALEDEDRPKFGFAYFSGTPTEPLPFGPVCFLLNLESAELRERVTLTPVDSSIPGLAPEEVGDALRAGQLLIGAIPANCGVRDNAQEGTPEAQVWGTLQVTVDQIRAIMAVVGSDDDPELDNLRVVAERQGIPLLVRVTELICRKSFSALALAFWSSKRMVCYSTAVQVSRTRPFPMRLHITPSSCARRKKNMA